nr:Chain A, MFS-bound Sans CEN2 peptide [Homo sapiens]
EELPWDELDLG